MAEQAAYVADFAASGLSATAFRRRLGIRRATLARWRPRAAAPRHRGATFAAVTVVPDAGDAPAPLPPPVAPQPRSLTLVLRGPSDMVADVAGLDVATVAALLRAVLTSATAGTPP